MEFSSREESFNRMHEFFLLTRAWWSFLSGIICVQATIFVEVISDIGDIANISRGLEKIRCQTLLLGLGLVYGSR